MLSKSMLMLAIIAAVLGLAVSAFAKDEPVKVFVNDVEKQLDPSAIVRDGKTYIPLRGGAEAVGATVIWEEETRTAVITLGNKRVRIPESEGIKIGDRLLIPLRLMAESLDCEVKWDPDIRAVRINNQEVRPPAGGG